MKSYNPLESFLSEWKLYSSVQGYSSLYDYYDHAVLCVFIDRLQFYLGVCACVLHATVLCFCSRRLGVSELCCTDGKQAVAFWAERGASLRWCFIQSSGTECVKGKKNGNSKNGDDRETQGVILTVSDGQVFWAVYVFVSVTCCQHAEQITPVATIASKLHDTIYCWMNQKWMIPRDVLWCRFHFERS